jgi:hypothetical protein
MAKKLRTGFELPFSNATGSDQVKTFSGNTDSYNYLFRGLCIGMANITTNQYVTSIGTPSYTNAPVVNQKTDARTLSNGTRGCYFSGFAGNQGAFHFDVSQFSTGFYANFWHIDGGLRSSHPLIIKAGSDIYSCYMSSTSMEINQGNTSTTHASAAITRNSNQWYNVIVSIDNAGLITFTFDGTTITHTVSGTPSFSTWTNIAIGTVRNGGGSLQYSIDDLAINDGSGATDTSAPPSIRGYNFFDAATLNASNNFATTGGGTILGNLQDGSDSTGVTSSTDLATLDFSLPTLAGTGMSEVVGDFSGIEAINIYTRQAEATTGGAVLNAKVDDDTAAVSNNSDINLPLSVSEKSTTLFNDGSSDWNLTNLNSGDFDLTLTFDKP